MSSEQPAVTDPTMHCLECGYPLDGLLEHRCPECGRKFDPADPRTFADQRWVKPSNRSGYTALAASCLGLALVVAPFVQHALIIGNVLTPPPASSGLIMVPSFPEGFFLLMGLSVVGAVASLAVGIWFWAFYRRRHAVLLEASISDTPFWIAAILAASGRVHLPAVLMGRVGSFALQPSLLVSACFLWWYVRTRHSLRRSCLHDAAGFIASAATLGWVRAFFSFI
jgi:hypothetical protein